jgi:hypothetical protein
MDVQSINADVAKLGNRLDELTGSNAAAFKELRLSTQETQSQLVSLNNATSKQTEQEISIAVSLDRRLFNLEDTTIPSLIAGIRANAEFTKHLGSRMDTLYVSFINLINALGSPQNRLLPDVTRALTGILDRLRASP